MRLTFAGSADLVSQIEQGAPADVLATADQATMSKAADQVAGSAVPFATNTMTIVVPTGNPAGIKALADLASADVKTVICAPQVPCGAATAKIEQSSGVTIHAVSEENAVAGVLGKVTSGEADAGVAYVTDAAGATLSTIAIDPSVNVHTTYMIGALAGRVVRRRPPSSSSRCADRKVNRCSRRPASAAPECPVRGGRPRCRTTPGSAPTTATRTDLPRWLMLPAVVGMALLTLPFLGLLARTDWGRLPSLLGSPSARTALQLSVETAAASTLVCLLLGCRSL